MTNHLEPIRSRLLSVVRKKGADDVNFELKIDFFLSSLSSSYSLYSMNEIKAWFQQQRKMSTLEIKKIPIKALKKWRIDQKTGTIRHESNKFFSVIGIHATSKQREVQSWSQPIIDQPEIGILGFLIKKIDGVYHFLAQAKEEPGNIEKVQVAPTLMATESNFTRVHGGKVPLFLDYFTNRKKEKVLFKKMQSEEGSKFYHKRNLNMVVEVPSSAQIDIPENFIWMNLCQLKTLMQTDNIVNASARSILACLP